MSKLTTDDLVRISDALGLAVKNLDDAYEVIAAAMPSLAMVGQDVTDFVIGEHNELLRVQLKIQEMLEGTYAKRNRDADREFARQYAQPDWLGRGS